MYYEGEGIEQDKVKAVYWFTKAAEQGLFEAQYNLTIMYNNGDGIEQDEQKASYWYSKSLDNYIKSYNFKR